MVAGVKLGDSVARVQWVWEWWKRPHIMSPLFPNLASSRWPQAIQARQTVHVTRGC